MNDQHSYDTIVVGGGLAGLSATLHLARSGHDVLLIERHTSIGGRARTDDLDGWLFNQGAHALYSGGPGRAALRSMGVEVDGPTAPLKGAQLSLDGRTTSLPLNARTIAGTKAISARSKLQFATLMARLPRLDPAEHRDVTVDAWLSQYRPDTAALVRALVRLATYTAATDVMSADAAISQLQGAGEGVLYLDGGWVRLCDALVAAATNAGAEIVTGSKVDAIDSDEAGYSVRIDDVRHDAPTVVVAAGGPELTGHLLGVAAVAFGEIGPPPQVAVLDLALDEMPANHRFVLGIDEPTYFSVHSPPAKLAPDGKVAAVVMRYIGPDDSGSADEHRESLERAAALAGVGKPIRSRFLRRMTVTNGMPLASAGGLPGRPSIDVQGRPGAFIAGDWVGPTGVLADAAIASGVAAAKAAATVVSSSTALA